MLRVRSFVTPWGWEVPTPAAEAWHYTNLRGLPMEGLDFAGDSLGSAEAEREVWLPAGFGWGAVDAAPVILAKGRVQWDWDAAAGAVVRPVRVVRVPAGAEVVLMEHHTGSGWLAPVLRLEVGAGAVVRHGIYQDMDAGGVLTRSEVVMVGDGARYTRVVHQRGGRLARVEPVVVAGAGCTVESLGLNETRGTATDCLHDHTVRVRHMGEGTATRVVQRNVVHGTADGVGTSVFQGAFFVAPDAQKTDAYMHCQNLILDGYGRAHQKPELEIYADDVTCSHGASTGGLREEQIFALRARGLDETQARALLVEGFVNAFWDGVPVDLRRESAA